MKNSSALQVLQWIEEAERCPMAEIERNDLYTRSEALIRTAKRCFKLGLQTNAGGNLSTRLASGNALLIKPSGVGFNECTHGNLMVADLEGSVVHGYGKPSKDLDFHAAIYKVRPDVQAIVHVHSPFATGWAAAGREIPPLTVQFKEKLGRLPLIPLSANGGPQGAKDIAPVMQDQSLKGAILANHGTIGLGKTLIDAQYVVELIEETAHIAFVQGLIGIASNGTAGGLPRTGIKPPQI